jgi:hypothetical protein
MGETAVTVHNNIVSFLLLPSLLCSYIHRILLVVSGEFFILFYLFRTRIFFVRLLDIGISFQNFLFFCPSHELLYVSPIFVIFNTSFHDMQGLKYTHRL